MKLTMNERLILTNQYLILEKLYPDDAGSFALARMAIQSGYEIAYDWHAPHINRDVMSEDESTEVLDILTMFEALKDSYDLLPTKPNIDEWRVRFMGFDGTREAKQLGFTYYLQKEGEFSAVLVKRDLDSHGPTLARYRKMVSEWKNSAAHHNLTKLTEADIVRIASV